MSTEIYTPGHSENSTDFMGKRTFESHGSFFSPHISSGVNILDLGCGPGTISVGLAKASSKGEVLGIDFGESQIEKARQNASAAGLKNLKFCVGSCYDLPFENCSFDRIFCHALMEHLSDPLTALQEAWRVLRPRGIVGICSPDADGWLLAPPSKELDDAVHCYAELQASNGGDLRIGKRLGALLSEAGFKNVQISARYEYYSSLSLIGNYLALQLERSGKIHEAQTFRKWSTSDSGMFAQSWISATGEKFE